MLPMLETPDEEESNLIDVKEFSKKFLAWTKKYANFILETEKKVVGKKCPDQLRRRR